MTIDDKYFLILGKYIYNKRLDKYGHISSIDIMHSIGGYCVSFRVFYDTFDSNSILFLDDFKKKDIQFIIVTGLDCDTEEYNKRQVEDIKTAFGDNFSEDMIIYVEESERVKKNEENNNRNTQMLHTDLVDLSNISVGVMTRDFYSRELYLKYKDGILTKEELLFALINHLCQELKRANDRNSEYFFKYEFLKEIENPSCPI